MPEGSEKQWHHQGNSATSHAYNLRSRLNWGCLWVLRESWRCPAAHFPRRARTLMPSAGSGTVSLQPPTSHLQQFFALSRLSSASCSAQAGLRLSPLPQLLSKAAEYKPRQGLVRASGAQRLEQSSSSVCGEGSPLRPPALPWGELPPLGVPSPNDPMPTGQQRLLQTRH